MDRIVGEQAPPHRTGGPVTTREKNVIIGGVLLAMFLAALDQTIVAPAMPTIGAALGHAEYLPWVVTAYLLTATAFAPLYGKLSDIHGRRLVIHAALFIFMVGSLISALAPNMLVLIIGRAMQGMGGGGLFALAQTVIGDLVPPHERARYTAWISGTWAVAGIGGPLLGGSFADYFHWSLIFWINIPLGLLAMAIVNSPLKKIAPLARHHRLDAFGALLLVGATALLLLALTWGGSRYSWASWQIASLLASSAAVWGAFAARLMSADEPLISLDILSNRVVLTGTLTMSLVQSCNVGLVVYLPIYLQTVLGLSVSHSGYALIGPLASTTVGALLSGNLILHVVHYKRMALAGVMLSACALVVMGLIAPTATLLSMEIVMICVAFGFGCAFPIVTISVQNAVDMKYLGVATGVLTFQRSLGGALGVAVLGAVALGFGLPLAAEGAAPSHPAASVPFEAFTAIFLVAAALMLAAFVCLLLMPEKPLRKEQPHGPPALAE